MFISCAARVTFPVSDVMLNTCIELIFLIGLAMTYLCYTKWVRELIIELIDM